MSCIEHNKKNQGSRLARLWVWLSVLGLGLIAGCTSKLPPPPPPIAPQLEPRPSAGPSTQPIQPEPPVKPPLLVLGPPKPSRNVNELRLQAAQRLVAANPERTYMGRVPDILLAIPVIEVELQADGRVKNIVVLRKPGQALDTVQLAIDAIHRAAPYGDVSRMPKPWRFTETFLFNDQRHFKPRTLDD